MSIQKQQTKQVYDAILEIAEGDSDAFRPGDIAEKLRSQAAPISVWAIRGELSTLEDQGLITCDESSGAWSLTQDAAKKQVSC